ncbi:hypothetical protein HK405_002008 [Cladochytrium tenue]|nr:hypothetical protein HK405_002008 [Cladochytrium tenue]
MHNDLNGELATARQTNSELQRQLESYKDKCEETLDLVESLRKLGTPETQKKMTDLETELASLKVEQSDLYRLQGQNAQRLLEVMEANRSHEDAIRVQSQEIRQLSDARATLSVRLNDALELTKEKDKLIEILKDELATHQLELSQRESELKTTSTKLARLESEHEQLLQRWLHQKQEEAAKAAHEGDINCIQVSYDGALVATGGNDKKVLLHDARTGKFSFLRLGTSELTKTSQDLDRERSSRQQPPLVGHTDRQSHENVLLTTSRDNSLKLIDSRTFNVLRTFTAENFRVGMNWSKSCFSPDGFFVASGSMDGSVIVWNSETGAVVQSAREHRSPVCGVAWGVGGPSAVCSAEKDRAFVLWGGR